jgi:hypothetical protein
MELSDTMVQIATEPAFRKVTEGVELPDRIARGTFTAAIINSILDGQGLERSQVQCSTS